MSSFTVKNLNKNFTNTIWGGGSAFHKILFFLKHGFPKLSDLDYHEAVSVLPISGDENKNVDEDLILYRFSNAYVSPSVHF